MILLRFAGLKEELNSALWIYRASLRQRVDEINFQRSVATARPGNEPWASPASRAYDKTTPEAAPTRNAQQDRAEQRPFGHVLAFPSVAPLGSAIPAEKSVLAARRPAAWRPSQDGGTRAPEKIFRKTRGIRWGVVGRRAARVTMLCTAGAAVLIGTYAVAIAHVLPKYFAVPPEVLARAHEENARGVIVDSARRVVGIVPAKPPGVGDRRRTGLHVIGLPERFTTLVSQLEDQSFGDAASLRWYGGADLVCIAAAPVLRRGCSTVPSMVTSLLLDLKWKERQHVMTAVMRKITEVASAPGLVARYTPEVLITMLATHAVLVTGGGGGDVVGLEAASWVLFNKPAADLTTAETAIFAAALKNPVLVEKTASAIGIERWRKNIERAKFAVQGAKAISEPERSTALTDLDRLGASPPVPAFNLVDVEIPFRARANLEARRVDLAEAEWTEIHAELKDRRLFEKNQPVAGLQLTLDVETSVGLRPAFEQALLAMQNAAGCEFRLRLSKKDSDGRRCADLSDDQAQVIALLAAGDGRVLRFFKSGDGASEAIFSGTAGRRENGGAYDFNKEIRAIGSVGKIPAALLLASLGDTAKSLYCELYYQGRRGVAGSKGFQSCSVLGAHHPAVHVFARSDNLSLHERLRRPDIDDAALRKLGADLHLMLPEDQTAAQAFAFGSVRAAPKTLSNLFFAIAQVLHDDPTETGIHMVHRVMPLDEGQWRRADAVNPVRPAVERYLASPQAREYVKTALRAPIEGGTLSFLRPLCEAARATCFGKTGTASVESPKHGKSVVSDKFVVGFMRMNATGEIFHFLTMIRAPRPGSEPLGKDVKGSIVLPLLKVLFTEATREAERGNWPPERPSFRAKQ